MKRLLVATGNQGKVAELRDLLQGAAEVITPTELGLELAVVEDGDSFAANAIKKAEAYAAVTELWCLADDSGLCVDALHGAPGVHSARFAADADRGSGDADNRSLLLERMQQVPDAERSAHFACAIAVARQGQTTRVFEGRCVGVIARAPRGQSGFGYDPLFEIAAGKTFAELPLADKQGMSHRGRALRAALLYLREVLSASPA